MSSFLTTPERSRGGTKDDTDEELNGPGSSSSLSSASRRRAFAHASVDMGSSPLRQRRLRDFHQEIRKKRDENAERARGGDFLLYAQYQSILASLEREADRFADDVARQAEMRGQDDLEHNDYCHGNSLPGIKDDGDFLDEMLEQEQKELEYLVDMMSTLEDPPGPQHIADFDTEPEIHTDNLSMMSEEVHGSTTPTINDSSFSGVSTSDEEMDDA